MPEKRKQHRRKEDLVHEAELKALHKAFGDHAQSDSINFDNFHITLGNIRDTLNEYIKSDLEWKRENDPYLKGLANLTGGAKILVWVAIAIGSIGGAWVAIKGLFK